MLDSENKRTWSYSIAEMLIPKNNKQILGVNLAGTNIICIDVDGTTKKHKTKLSKKKLQQLPNWLLNLPYTKSRNTQNPHFYCRVRNIPSWLKNKQTIHHSWNGINFDIMNVFIAEKKSARIYNYNNLFPMISARILEKLNNSAKYITK